MPRVDWRVPACWLLAVFFLAAGLLHVVATPEFMKIVPPPVPLKREVVWLTGLLEITFAVGLVIPRLRRVTGWILAGYLLAVLPANVYMALERVEVAGVVLPDWLAWVRVALQFGLIWLVLRATRVQQPGVPIF